MCIFFFSNFLDNINNFILICFYVNQRIDAFELLCWRRLLSPLDCKEIKPVNPKGNQSWILIGRTEAEAEAAILWPPDVKSWLEKTLMLGDIEGRRRRGGRGWNDWMVSLTQWTWIEQTMGDGDRQGSLAHCSPWGHKESDMTEWLNWEVGGEQNG